MTSSRNAAKAPADATVLAAVALVGLYLAVTCHDYPQAWDVKASFAVRRAQSDERGDELGDEGLGGGNTDLRPCMGIDDAIGLPGPGGFDADDPRAGPAVRDFGRDALERLQRERLVRLVLQISDAAPQVVVAHEAQKRRHGLALFFQFLERDRTFPD